MNKPKLKVTVGIPASGKSRWAEDQVDLGTITLSSDALRKELFGDENHQEDNDTVFKTLYDRARNALREGVDVVIDATNISAKRRIALIDKFKNENCEFEAHYFSTLYDVCIHRNMWRDRTVPDDVLKRMYMELQVPQYNEGWDNIVIHTDSFNYEDHLMMPKVDLNKFKDWVHEQLCYKDLGYDHFSSVLQQVMRKPDFDLIYNVGQDSKYHSLTITRHIYYVWKYVVENYDTFNLERKEKMSLAAVFHDVGKGFCKNFKEGSRYANFIGHESVSSQMAVFYLKSLGYDDLFTLDVVNLVQLHMRYMNIESNKSYNKLLNQVGEEVMNDLKFFYEADLEAK